MRRRIGSLATLVAVLTLAACSTSAVSQATSLASTPASSGDTSTAPSAEPSEDAVASVAPATPTSIPDAPPPKPGDPTWTLANETTDASGKTTTTYEITWTEPDGAASAFLVYGMTVCLRDEAKYDGQPCVVRGMKIDKDTLIQIGQAPGDARAIRVSWESSGEGPGPYPAILLRATNAAGDSIFTIVHSNTVCFQCTY